MTAAAENLDPVEAAAVDRARLALLRGRARRRFRGDITDYARTIWLGSGYIGDWAIDNLCRNCRAKGIKHCRHFEIDTARHLAGPFAAIADENVRVVMLLKAAQTAGSLTWDLSVHYLLVHSSFMRIKVLMDCDEKARKYCVERLMETLRANPDIAPLLPTGSERFGVTDTAMRLLNGKTLFVGGLNESNASSLPADVMILDEGWLHQSDGLMKKAFDRLKQTKNGKIIVVGQAGNVDEDQDRIWKSLHRRVPLTWACPCCGGRQPFELNRQRPADFVPTVARLTIPANDELRFPPAPPAPMTYCGFKIAKKFSELDTPEKIKSACSKTTVECFHCGFEIADTPGLRQALNASYQQEYQEMLADGTKYTPEGYTVGFWNPDPASMFVPFRETMEEYVIARKANEQFGNLVPLQTFYLSRWAQPWANEISAKSPERPGASLYDVKEKIPGELARISATDIQFKLTHMVYLAVVVGDGVPPRVLHFEWVKPPAGLNDFQAAEHCKSRVRALDKEFGIQPQNSMKDCAHEPQLVREWAAEDAVWGRIQSGGRLANKWISYGLLLGDDRASYRWPHPGRRDTWERFKQFQFTNVDAIKNGRREKIPIHHRLWSNPSIKEIAERWRDGLGAPKLQIHEKWLADTSKDGLWEQLNSEEKKPWKGNPNKLVYQRKRPENHAWDCFCMIVVRMDELGCLNSFSPPAEDNVAAE